ncbi:MAG TPA: hypothetical protein DDW90_08130 [Cyanobacteria bacterium UBA9971]|nr:hypothetical protein [Cyanobacteria bacterium UBA9971]HCR36154.1 hypothetical protein [Candidatus Woesebacteria bacterium]
MVKRLVFLFLFLFVPINVYCAELVTFSVSKSTMSGLRTLTIEYETAADGSLSTATRISVSRYYGFILKIRHIPGSTPVTTGVADITLKDDAGVDVFGTALSNIDTSDTIEKYSMIDSNNANYPIGSPTTLQLDIASNSGVSATGTIIITLL